MTPPPSAPRPPAPRASAPRPSAPRAVTDGVGSALAQATAEWFAELGEEGVVTSAETIARQLKNTSEFKERRVPLLLRPLTAEHVRIAVTIADRHRLSLSPFSTGRNWGFGSKLPVKSGAVLLDLSRMNRILEVSEELGHALIEPGVTQGQLADHLLKAGSGLKLNVTGSGRDTSIVGNVLDRGGGNLGARIDDLAGMEVVLANGDVLRTGLWDFHERGTPHTPVFHYPPGLGPDLNGLFVQSNLGVVTKLALRLHRKVPLLESVLAFSDANLEKVIDVIRSLREESVLNGHIRMMEGVEPIIRFFPRHSRPLWSMQATMYGSRGMRREARLELDARLAGLLENIDHFDTEIDRVDSRGPEEAPLLEARLALANGIPSDRTLQGFGRAVGREGPVLVPDVDEDPSLPGFMCLNVVLPFLGRSVMAAHQTVKEVAREFGVQAASANAALGRMALSGFYPFYVNRRDPQSVSRGHRFKDAALRRLETIGVYPMRLDVDSMSHFRGPQSGAGRTLEQIKRALDPNETFAAGRYIASPEREAAPAAWASPTRSRDKS